MASPKVTAIIILCFCIASCSAPLPVGDIEIGHGDQVPVSGAFQAKVSIWEDDEGRKPFKRGTQTAIFPLRGGRYPGIAVGAEGMKVGGVRRFKVEAQDLFDSDFLRTKPPDIRPSGEYLVEVSMKEILPFRQAEIEVFSKGKGSRTAGGGDQVRYRFSIWTDRFDGEAPYGKTKRVLETTIGDELWSLYLDGAAPGEIRRIRLPRQSSCQLGGYPEAGEYCGFCFDGSLTDIYLEIELLDFMN